MANCLCFPQLRRELPPDDSLVAMLADAVLLYQAALAAHELGLFEALGGGPLPVEALASRLGLTEMAVDRLATALAALGLVARQGTMVRSTPLAAMYLESRSPWPMAALLDLERKLLRTTYTYDQLLSALRAGGPARSSGDWIGTALGDAREARAFTLAMHAHSVPAARVWTRKVDLSGHHLFLDVGGGSGAHALAAVEATAGLRAKVLELPMVCGFTSEMIHAAGLGARVEALRFDFWRDAFPAADLHFYGDVFHDWPIDACRKLVEKSFAALPSGGRILVHEMLLAEDRQGPAAVAASGLAMLLLTGGGQLTGGELLGLLGEAGFSDLALVPGLGCWSLVCGRKP